LLGVVLNIGILQIALRMGRKQPYKFTDMFYGFNHHPDKFHCEKCGSSILSD
jgi:hypothetical protein